MKTAVITIALGASAALAASSTGFEKTDKATWVCPPIPKGCGVKANEYTAKCKYPLRGSTFTTTCVDDMADATVTEDKCGGEERKGDALDCANADQKKDCKTTAQWRQDPLAVQEKIRAECCKDEPNAEEFDTPAFECLDANGDAVALDAGKCGNAEKPDSKKQCDDITKATYCTGAWIPVYDATCELCGSKEKKTLKTKNYKCSLDSALKEGKCSGAAKPTEEATADCAKSEYACCPAGSDNLSGATIPLPAVFASGMAVTAIAMAV